MYKRQNSSTILTHLNWGASYLVHDFYRRFIRTGKPDSHYVVAGRLATVLLFLASSATVFALDTAKDAFLLLLQIGAGTGLLYLVRWFWWRVTAWCEIVAMTSSFVVSMAFLILKKYGVEFESSAPLLITVAITTVCWISTAYLGPQTDERTLISFFHKVRPFGPGWERIRRKAGITAAEATADGESASLSLAMLGWLSGCIMIWSALFTVGNFLYGRMGYAFALLAVFVVTALVLIRVIQRLWK